MRPLGKASRLEWAMPARPSRFAVMGCNALAASPSRSAAEDGPRPDHRPGVPRGGRAFLSGASKGAPVGFDPPTRSVDAFVAAMGARGEEGRSPLRGGSTSPLPPLKGRLQGVRPRDSYPEGVLERGSPSPEAALTPPRLEPKRDPVRVEGSPPASSHRKNKARRPASIEAGAADRRGEAPAEFVS
jgi:hypothetical protein